jgi:CheY-like chemotaxis protein
VSDRILVVEDEQSIRTIIEYALRDAGFSVLSAARGDEALESLRREPVDLVILDLMLPGLDGLEVCKRIRAERSVPIIILSARGEELDKVLGLELGADDYVTKPFSPRELASRGWSRIAPPRCGPASSRSTRSPARCAATTRRSPSPTRSSRSCASWPRRRAGCSPARS